ncbi:hypothetical protein ACFLTS_03695 [Chloroflexota bacterium]
MSTVRALVHLNRDLRKQIQAGLDRNPQPFDGRLIPLLFLSMKLMRHHEALEVLALRDFGSEAGILTRTMFELT